MTSTIDAVAAESHTLFRGTTVFFLYFHYTIPEAGFIPTPIGEHSHYPMLLISHCRLSPPPYFPYCLKGVFRCTLR